jgi:hypothetical protein
VYGKSPSGSDWQEYHVMELATKKTLDDTLQWVKVSTVAWAADGFFYSRYPAPDQAKAKAGINENHQVWFHKVGTPQSQDQLVYSDPANPQRFHIVETTEDERFAVLSVSERGKGKDGNALFVRDLAAGDKEFTPLIPDIYAALDTVSRELVGFVPSVNRNATAERAAVGQSVTFPIAPPMTAYDVTPAMAIPEPPDVTPEVGTMAITKSRAVPFGFTGEEQRALNSGAAPGYLSLQGQMIAQALRTLTNEVEADGAAAARGRR